MVSSHAQFPTKAGHINVLRDLTYVTEAGLGHDCPELPDVL